MAIQKKLRTVAEFEQFADSPEHRDRLLELINGEIFEKMPTEEHGVISLTIGAALKNHVKLNDIAGRVGVEIRHRNPTDNHNARIPDVSFRYTDEPAVKKGSVESMPDLAVEVLSPDDEYQDLLEKAHFYLLNGSQIVWLVFPKSRTIGVCTLLADGEIKVRTLEINDVLDGGDVLSGFQLAVKEIFDV